jgi:hypothetical protein
MPPSLAPGSDGSPLAIAEGNKATRGSWLVVKDKPALSKARVASLPAPTSRQGN